MKDLDVIKRWLVTKKGSWKAISKDSGVSTRTLTNIVNSDEPRITMSTLRKLQLVRRMGSAKVKVEIV